MSTNPNEFLAFQIFFSWSWLRILPPTLIVCLWFYTEHILFRYTALDTKESARAARSVVADVCLAWLRGELQLPGLGGLDLASSSKQFSNASFFISLQSRMEMKLITVCVCVCVCMWMLTHPPLTFWRLNVF
jgi:hypothetical protein